MPATDDCLEQPVFSDTKEQAEAIMGLMLEAPILRMRPRLTRSVFQTRRLAGQRVADGRERFEAAACLCHAAIAHWLR